MICWPVPLDVDCTSASFSVPVRYPPVRSSRVAAPPGTDRPPAGRRRLQRNVTPIVRARRVSMLEAQTACPGGCRRRVAHRGRGQTSLAAEAKQVVDDPTQGAGRHRPHAASRVADVTSPLCRRVASSCARVCSTVMASAARARRRRRSAASIARVCASGRTDRRVNSTTTATTPRCHGQLGQCCGRPVAARGWPGTAPWSIIATIRPRSRSATRTR